MNYISTYDHYSMLKVAKFSLGNICLIIVYTVHICVQLYVLYVYQCTEFCDTIHLYV